MQTCTITWQLRRAAGLLRPNIRVTLHFCRVGWVARVGRESCFSARPSSFYCSLSFARCRVKFIVSSSFVITMSDELNPGLLLLLLLRWSLEGSSTTFPHQHQSLPDFYFSLYFCSARSLEISPRDASLPGFTYVWEDALFLACFKKRRRGGKRHVLVLRSFIIVKVRMQQVRKEGPVLWPNLASPSHKHLRLRHRVCIIDRNA